MWIKCVSLFKKKQNKEDTFLANWLKIESINSERGNTESWGARRNQPDTREPSSPRVCTETTPSDVLEKHYVSVISHEPLQWIQPNCRLSSDVLSVNAFSRSWGLPDVSPRKEVVDNSACLYSWALSGSSQIKGASPWSTVLNGCSRCTVWHAYPLSGWSYSLWEWYL